MQVKAFVSSSAFDENQIKILTEAFEEAILLAGISDRTGLQAEAVAQRIILQFTTGERDPKQICRQAAAN